LPYPRKCNEYAGFAASRPARLCQSTLNTARTCGTIDTPATHVCSRHVLTAERLRELLSYDPLTGIFRRVVARQGVHVGMIAGSVNNHGYRHVGLDGSDYREHRLAFLYMTGKFPDFDVDHRNLDRADNRWVNLRHASRSENNANTPRRRDNSSGSKGVGFHKGKSKWRARIRVNGRQFHLGYFEAPEEAHQAYVGAARKYFGAFANDGSGGGHASAA
jgi:hypothetical protein